MTSTTSSTLSPTLGLPSSAPASATLVFRLLQRLQQGRLLVHLPDGSSLHFGNVVDGAPQASIRLRNWNVCGAALRSGDVGFAETYIAGDWTTPDLHALLALLIRNREQIEKVIYGSWWGSLAHRLRHVFNRNSRRGSRRNIHAHYDLGNAFYSLWLDPTMNYSSAWFDGDRTRSLVHAQHAKVRRALTEAGVQPGDRVLEIGCGWGAVAEAAARDFSAEVTGVTLSHEQLAWGQERLSSAGLAGDLRFQDYRDVREGPYDAVVSIEMFEAVGREYWPVYFEAVRQQLKPGARACIQTITIRDDLFDRYLRSSDFIQQYIFPGGVLPSPSEFRAAASRAGLAVVNELDFGADYALTLAQWRSDFLRQDTAVRNLGFDTRFMRTWDFYLAYCQAAFETGNTGVMQFTLQRA
jgi:cyclopropane-fatty-acyl-phospholipid synthase